MKKLHTKLAIFTLTALITFNLAGCDNKNDSQQASKMIKQALVAISDKGDFEKAQDILRKIPRNASPQATEIINGTVYIAQAGKIKTQMSNNVQNINTAISEIKESTHKINELISKKENISSTILQRNKKLELLKFGNEQVPGLEGLKEQKQNKQEEISQLNSQIDKLESQAKQAKENADYIQSQANQLFEKARTQQDNAKQISLEKQAYEVLAGKGSSQSKSELMGQYQQCLDEISLLESQKDIINKEITNLQNEIDNTQKQIDNFQTVNNQLNLSQNLSTINSQITQIQQALNAKIDGLDDLVTEFNNTVTTSMELLENAQESFQNSRGNREISQMSQMLTADAASKKAQLYASASSFYQTISQNLGYIAKSADTTVSSSIAAAEKKYANNAQNTYSKAVELFDMADQSYEQSSFRPNCPVLKQRIIILMEKASLASIFEKTEDYSAIVETINQLTSEVYQCDEQFQQSNLDKKIKNL